MIDFSAVDALFTDMDGTLTTAGRLAASTYQAIADLDAAGIPVIIVTGRPAGWAEAIHRLWPVKAVVAENGGVLFLPGGRKRYGVPVESLKGVRKEMHAAARAVARRIPGARLSTDAVYTEVNLALDWNEDVHLPEARAREMEMLLRGYGFNAVRSSVHVNFWPGRFNKLSACKKVVRELGGKVTELARYLYLGDALNDEPMFRGFPRSVGVANIRAVWDELRHKPSHVTQAAEGAGFEEVARAVLRAARSGDR